MLKKRKQIICYILAVFMLFTGVCFENVKADSLFECAKYGTVTSYIGEKNADIEYSKACTNEMLGADNACHVKQLADESIYNIRRDMKLSAFIIYVDNATKISSDFWSLLSFGHSKELYSKTVILNFIHSEDGKK